MRFDLMTVLGLASVVIAIPQYVSVGSSEMPAGSEAYTDALTNDTVIDVDPELVRQLMTNETHYNHKRDDLHPRAKANRGIFICAHRAWQDRCQWFGGVDDGKCRNTPMTVDASMSPDRGVHCTLFRGRNCPGVGHYPLEYPGIGRFDSNMWWDACMNCDAYKNPACAASPESYKCQSF